MKFESISDLKKEIENDKKSNMPSAIRYPVRFIFVNSFKTFGKIVSYLTANHSYIIDFSEQLPNKDGWLTKDEIIKIINKINKTSVVIPLSEILRFFAENELKAVIRSLTEIESNNNVRIYIPLLGFWERFKRDFWDRFHRRDFWEPIIWLLDEGVQKANLYQLNFEIKSYEDMITIGTTKEWLNLWKKENIDKIISFSKSLSFLSKNFLPDTIFDVIYIANHRDYLAKLINANIDIEYKEKDKDYWDKLTKEVAMKKLQGSDLDFIISQHFNIHSLNTLENKDYLRLYMQYSSKFDRWLLKNFILYTLSDSYLYFVLKKVKRFEKDEILRLLWFSIFDDIFSEKQEYFSQRKELLEFLHKELRYPCKFIEEELKIKLTILKEYNLRQAIKYITGLTYEEKKYILVTLKNSENLEENLTIIKNVYPELYHYISWEKIILDNSNMEDWILDYFKEYNASKISDLKTEGLEELLDSKNQDKNTFSDWYYGIEKPMLEAEKTIWIDGLGVEWLSLIIYLIEEHGREKGWYIQKKYITTVNIPSITECNKYRDIEKIDLLDNHIHNENPYKYPDDLITEIEKIGKIITEDILNKNCDKIAIVSDHGFTFLAQKRFGNTKKFNFKRANHEGRCMWIDSKFNDDEYFMVWNTEDDECKGRNSLVALKHPSLCNTPSREVHGGVTPEEILVPYIVISKQIEDVKYEIKPTKFEVTIKKPIISFKIKPEPKFTPTIKLNDREFKMIRKNKEWQIDLTGLKTGEYDLILIIGSKRYKIFVKIRGGFKEWDLL